MKNLKKQKNERLSLQGRLSSLSLGKKMFPFSYKLLVSLLFCFSAFFISTNVFGQIKENENSDSKTVYVKVVQVTDGDIVEVDKKIINGDDVDLNKLLDELDADIAKKNPKATKGGKNIKKSVVIIKSDSANDEDFSELINELNDYKIVSKVCTKFYSDEDGNLDSNICRKIAKKCCKDLSSGQIDSLIQLCLKDTCQKGNCCIVKCMSYCCNDTNCKTKCSIKQSEKCSKRVSAKANTEDSPKVKGENLEVEHFNFYPNPNKGSFTLTFDMAQNENTPTIINITDLSGRSVYKEKLSDFSGTYSKQIDLTGVSKGTYLLDIRQGKKTISKKIMVE